MKIAAFWENPETFWLKFSTNSAEVFWEFCKIWKKSAKNLGRIFPNLPKNQTHPSLNSARYYGGISLLARRPDLKTHPLHKTARERVLATVGAFFERFASNLVETCIWPRRIELCEKTLWRNNVMTLWRKNVHFDGFLAPVARFFDRFASKLVETCTRYRRIVLYENICHDVTTSWRNYVKTSFLAVFRPL